MPAPSLYKIYQSVRTKRATASEEYWPANFLMPARRSSRNYSCQILGIEEFLNRRGLGEQSEEEFVGSYLLKSSR